MSTSKLHNATIVIRLTVASSFLLLLSFHACARAASDREALHRRILAGEEIFFSASDPWEARTIEAKWIKEAALLRARIAIHQAMIEGPLDAQDTVFDQGFDLENSIVEGEANFSNAVFKRDFQAYQVTFCSWVMFQGASFERSASFNFSKFESGAVLFEGAHFFGAFHGDQVDFASKGISFGHVRFDSDADFAMSHFGGGAFFGDAQFAGQAFFAGTMFDDSVDFERAHFIGVTTFGSIPADSKFEAKFKGDATFVDTMFESTTIFDGVTFNKNANFFNARFNSRTYFRGTVFGSKCEFMRAWFGSDVFFSGAKFQGQSNFSFAHIAGSLVFDAAKPLPASLFRGQAQFGGVQVDGQVSFGGGEEFGPGAVFESKAFFNAVKFGGPTSFQGADFKGDVQFASAWLGTDVFFPGTMFEGDVFFDRTQFMGAALFSSKLGSVNSNFAQSARFLRKASFASVHFNSVTRFSRVRFEGDADFNGAHFENDAHFEDSVFLGPSSFRSVVFKAVYFLSAETAGKQPFQNDVDLLGCTYERIQIDWRSLLRYPNGNSRIQPYDRQPFIELEEVLRKSGSQEDADAVYVERRRVERLKLKGLRKFWDSVYWLFANYGIDLYRELITALIFLVIGMIIFSHPRAVLVGTGDSYEETKMSWDRALSLAVRQFLPFGLPVKPPWTPSRHVLYRYLPWPFRRATSYANFLQILGWILIPLGGAALAGLLRHVGQ